MTTMRAKLRVSFIHEYFNGPDKAKSGEGLVMSAVCAPKFDPEGLDEDNTFAKFTPSANLSVNISNPDLLDKFKVGQAYSVDFTPAP